MSGSSDGFERLGELVGELGRIGKKKEVAEANGATAAQVAKIDELIGELKKAIADAAAAEVKREVEDAKKEAGRLKRGRPKKPCPADNGPGDQKPPKPPPTGGGGGGAGGAGAGGAGSGFFGIPDAPNQAAGTSNIPAAQCIYVRSEDTVWAWNRFAQQWEQQDFSSPIQQVTPVGGGLLVIALREAAIFDCTLAAWLPMMRTNETLLLGNVTPGTAQPPIRPTTSAAPASSVPASAFQPQPAAGAAEFNASGEAPTPNTPGEPIIQDPFGGIPIANVPDPDLNPNLVIEPEPPLDFPEPPVFDPAAPDGGDGGGGNGEGGPGGTPPVVEPGNP